MDGHSNAVIKFQNMSNGGRRKEFGSRKVSSDAIQCKNITNPKRPMNSFMVWLHSARKKIRELRPNMSNIEICKQLSLTWNMMSNSQRQPFIDEAERLKSLHMHQYPGYRFNPQKKVNMTKIIKHSNTSRCSPQQSHHRSASKHKLSCGQIHLSSKTMPSKTGGPLHHFQMIRTSTARNPNKFVKLTIDKKFEDSICDRKHFYINASKLTPPVEVLYSDEGLKLPQSVSIYDARKHRLYRTMHTKLSTSSNDQQSISDFPGVIKITKLIKCKPKILHSRQIHSQSSASSSENGLYECGKLSEILKLPSSQAEEFDRLNFLQSFAESKFDHMGGDCYITSSKSHFEFPDFTSPEIMDIIGEDCYTNFSP